MERNIQKTISALLTSRKVLLAGLGVLNTLVLHYFDIDPEVWLSINALLVTVIGGIALEDAAAKRSEVVHVALDDSDDPPSAGWLD